MLEKVKCIFLCIVLTRRCLYLNLPTAHLLPQIPGNVARNHRHPCTTFPSSFVACSPFWKTCSAKPHRWAQNITSPNDIWYYWKNTLPAITLLHTIHLHHHPFPCFPHVFHPFPLFDVWTPWKGKQLSQQSCGMWAQNWFLSNLQHPTSSMIGDGIQPPAAIELNPQCRFTTWIVLKISPFHLHLEIVYNIIFNIRTPKCIISWPEHLSTSVMRLLEQKSWCQMTFKGFLDWKGKHASHTTQKEIEWRSSTDFLYIFRLRHVNLVHRYASVFP